MKRLGKRGFTLVEIMIVVAIIALLAAIAIPNLLRARHNANEAAAIASLRTISTACESFRAAQTPVNYPASLAALGPVVGGVGSTPPYIDATLAAATAADGAGKQGYWFNYNRASNHTYSCVASPLVSGTTGTRVFTVTESGVVTVGGAPIE